MSIIWAEGFDHYGTTPSGGRTAMLSGAWADFDWGNGNAPAISSVQARTGTYSLRFDYNSLATDGVLARRVLGSAHIVVGLAGGWYFNSLPNVNGEHGFEFRNNANNCIAYLAIQSDGAIGLYTGSGRTLIASSDPVITAAAWQHIEAKIVADTVVGEVEVRVNGLTVLHMTDINLGSLGATQVVYGMPNSDSGGSLVYYIDDLVAWNDDGTANNDFIGPARVETIFPVADTAVADFTPVGDADGFDCIDNVPPDGDTTYISGAAEGDVSEFELGTLPPETEIIRCVYIPFMGKLEDAGIGNAQVSLVSGADVSLGPDTVLTTAYTYCGGTHDVDPATGLEWTKAGLEAALVRVEKTI